MQYRLIGKNDYLINPVETILNNRGIEDIGSFLNVNESHVHSWKLLKNINKAIDCLLKHVNGGGEKVFVQTDADL